MPPATMISQKRDVSCETEAEMMGAKVSCQEGSQGTQKGVPDFN